MSAARRERVWNVPRENRAETAELARALGIPRIAAHLLTLRGIRTPGQGAAFLHPSLDALSDPFLLTDMQAAVDRIALAREKQERVLVFGDYDVDGISGTALLSTALRSYGIESCECGLPDRLSEGYGLGPDHVTAAHFAGTSLIITVDNGVNARDAATMARQLGVDLIVTDHHQIEGELPDALAVVNPKREGESYPGYNLAGVGVAFQLARALTSRLDNLDLVALGTVADIVPLHGENRMLVTHGLREMIRNPRVGLSNLARAASVTIEEITAEKIAFQLGPRLNAAGRLGDGAVPLELLLTDSSVRAAELAAQLDKANTERRGIEKDIFDEAVEELDATLTDDHHGIVVWHRDWHAGVIGIVASRLMNRYDRPVVIVAVDEAGIGRGSARCHPGFDMAGALGKCAKHLTRFGGHAAAAGLALDESRLSEFKDAFEEVARHRLRDCDPAPTLDIDALVSLNEIDAQ
ncbi:MAG: single-stranded-DNA-specific exonuclease RecJ, partial [Nitrospiraceae bacterium]|nr:single-stranded-DNA-specific exonuclease RecJ [Nitrospiraceae bacterium]